MALTSQPTGRPLAAPQRPASEPEPQRSFCDLHDAMKEQERLLGELERMSEDIGKAKAMREVDSDLRKKILANLMEPFIREGDSAAAAEVKARGLKLYSEDLSLHQRALAEAERTLARKEWIFAKLEALRTVISTERELLSMR